MHRHIPNNIKQLIEKALKGEISAAENELLQLWYDEPVTDDVIWTGNHENSTELKNSIFAEVKTKMVRAPLSLKLPFYKRTIFKVAASLLLTVGIGYAVYQYRAQPAFITSAQQSGIKKVILSDNTIVWLKGKSTISYPEEFTDSIRLVHLEGEALFEVSKNKALPFVVETGNYRTRVLGTSFNLNTNNKDFVLIVLTGKVQVSRLDNSNNRSTLLAVVTPNQRFEYQQSQPVAVSIPKEEEKLTVVKGTEYSMKFEHTPFSEVRERIANKFNVRFADADYSGYANCSINADLTDQSLENSLELLTAVIGATYKLENKLITIEGGQCR